MPLGQANGRAQLHHVPRRRHAGWRNLTVATCGAGGCLAVRQSLLQSDVLDPRHQRVDKEALRKK